MYCSFVGVCPVFLQSCMMERSALTMMLCCVLERVSGDGSNKSDQSRHRLSRECIANVCLGMRAIKQNYSLC